jgi:hypothetical protein
MLSIIDHFLRLRGEHDFVTPMALYSDPLSTTTKLINSTNIEALMRRVAYPVYNLSPKRDKKELQRWSAHSLRVGVCVILHFMAFTETQIKWLLPWRSNAFMVYLRNLAVLSDWQHAVFDEAAAMPHSL